MASSDLARLVVKLEAQTASYDASLKKANAQLRKFRNETSTALGKIEKQFSNFGRAVARTFAVGGIVGALYGFSRAIKSSIEAGDDLAKFSEKSGLAAKAASELAHAAKMTDIDLQTFATGIKKMQVTLSEASQGQKTAITTLKALGLSFDDLKGQTPDKQLEIFAERISQLKNPADRTRAAVELFGRAGADLLPLFEDGAEGIRKARLEAEELGKSFTEADLQRFQDADDAFKRLKQSASSLGDTIALKVGPALADLADRLRVLIGGGTERENLIDQLTNQLKAYGGAGAAFNADKIAAITAKLDLLMNPMNDPLAGRGRVAKVGELPAGYEPLKAIETQAKLSKQALEELERYKNQTITMRNDAAGALSSISPSVGDFGPLGTSENDKALNAYFAGVNAENMPLTRRAIEFNQVLDESKQKADDLMTTLKDEAARQAFTAISDVIYNMGKGMDDFAKSALDAFRRILANSITAQLFEMLGSLGGGGKNGGFLGFIGGLFSGMTGATVPGRATGGPVSSGHPYMVGERGPELFVPDASGSIVPSGMGLTYAPVINAQGADKDLRAALPGILAEDKRRFYEVLRDQWSRGR